MPGELNKMRYLTLLLLIACSLFEKVSVQKTNFWDILEEYQSSWDGEKIISLLGSPVDVVSGPNANEKSWLYYSQKTKFQSWVIGITTSNRIRALAYFPTSSGKSLYIMDVEKRWSSKKCEHKKATVLTAGHHYTEERTLICDGGSIKVPYNRYNEVEGIYINRN